jgi:hypothetical protein
MVYHTPEINKSISGESISGAMAAWLRGKEA